MILWSERRRPAPTASWPHRRCSTSPETLSLADGDGAGLLEIPAGTNGRGLREAGVLPNAGPGLSELAGRGECRGRPPRR